MVFKATWQAVSSVCGRAPRFIVSAPIYLYRYVISPNLPKTCRYEPTCSAYALEAIEKHGAFKGIILMVMRLSRCTPWSACHHHDPVPEEFALFARFKRDYQQGQD